jgi:hypothetical protein
LRERAIIIGDAEGRYISLNEGRGTAEVVAALAGAGFAVEGIWQQDQTLEDFYLTLVKNPPPLPGRN